jgi:hypothetical protein
MIEGSLALDLHTTFINFPGPCTHTHTHILEISGGINYIYLIRGVIRNLKAGVRTDITRN